MNIAVLGPGAMGQLFGGYLSRENHVTLIGRNPAVMEQIRTNGILIRENDGAERIFHPDAQVGPADLAPVDLLILFVKAGALEAALSTNRNLIGPDTLVLTLQNGSGHDELMRRFAPEQNILIGTTQQGSYRLSDTAICHSGLGSTAFGGIFGDSSRFAHLAELFTRCGFPAEVTDGIQGMIWNKLMINASSSILSGVLQTAQGYIAEDPDAWALAEKLIRELCAVATADGWPFDPEEQIDRVRSHLRKAPAGFTSVYADIKAGRVTEANVITGAVVRAGYRLGVPTPTHETILALVHAMERRK